MSTPEMNATNIGTQDLNLSHDVADDQALTEVNAVEKRPAFGKRAWGTGAALLMSVTGLAATSVNSEIAYAEAAPAVAEANIDGLSYIKIAEPYRAVDTRSKDSEYQRISADGTLDIRVGGELIPKDADSVILNLTAAGADGSGFLTAYPAGTPRPNTSNINPEHKGQDIANIAFVKLGNNGAISVYSSIETDLVADVIGYTLRVTDPNGVADGRLEAITPVRLVDTRQGVATPYISGQINEISVASTCDPNKYGAIAINLTAINPSGPGYLQAFGSGNSPSNSNVNFGAHETTSNTAIVPIVDGKIKVRAVVGGDNGKDAEQTHIAADGVACLTNENAEKSLNGTYEAFSSPQRLLDTRDGDKVQPGQSVFARLRSASGRKIQAFFANITATQAEGPYGGYVTADNLGDNGRTSVLNLVDGQTKAIGAIVPTAVTPTGEYGNYLRPGADEGMSMHLIEDVAGGFVSDIEPTLTNPGDGEPDPIIYDQWVDIVPPKPVYVPGFAPGAPAGLQPGYYLAHAVYRDRVTGMCSVQFDYDGWGSPNGVRNYAPGECPDL